ncbi:MAG: NADP-dependent phosphogluconate dehydrogenase, partial [Saprospiraceae bacterium]|nr:NADP-dependent phosphogluconate dehydrogenase [Saprospiraceae bacterium]
TDGAGHFVKMVHNGIEYADMQIISEIYHVSKSILGQSNHQTADMMQKWQKTMLKSYLLEITIVILRYEDKGEPLLEKILDVAGHKGTGQWTINEALQFGIAIPTITAAMNERIISGNKSLRSSLSDLSIHTDKNKGRITKNMLKGALIFSRLVALAEGIHLIQYASKHYKWPIDIAEVAQIWRGGCIIRSEMLLYVKRAFSINNEVNHLFEIPEIASLLLRYKSETEKLLSILIKCDISSPSISAALNYYKSMHTSYLPINLIQAQRDYFGAHTYKIVEKGETIYHTKWGK